MGLSFKEDHASIYFVIDQLNNSRRNMTEWEKQFIESIKIQFDDGLELTGKQLEKLSDLWEKY